MPAVAITNPSDHFQTVLAPGSGGLKWKLANTADNPFDTVTNQVYGFPTSDLLNDADHPLFEWVRSLNIDGHTDWYIPARWEANILYRNLKPTTDTNNLTGHPTNNPYGITGQTGSFTSTVPAQTSVAAFQAGGAEAFIAVGHWTATQDGADLNLVYVQSFGNGYSFFTLKSSGGASRAIRRVAFTGSEPAIGAAYEGGFLGGFISTNSSGTATHALIVAPKAEGEVSNTFGILDAAQDTFANGLWWIKSRASSNQHQFVDSVRGGNLALQCPSLALETAYVAPSNNSVGWCWNAPDTFTGSGGTISSSGRRNTSAGFSIVSYQGTGSAGTIAHGLSQAPEFVIVKNRLASGGFVVAHKDIDILNGNLALQTSNPPQGFGSGWVDALSAATFSIRAGGSNIGNVGSSGADYIAYCWHSVPGYSSIGSYVGNGNPDGPFVYTGHRVGWLLVKCSSTGSTDWYIWDSERNTYNPAGNTLRPNVTGQETVENYIDMLSNGFKLREVSASYNATGSTYIYIAFAEHPFGGANVSPSPAR
jgi:hypothetical protein